jgi:hypothetical protein
MTWLVAFQSHDKKENRHMPLKQIEVRNIKPNPYRNMKTYPIDEEKIGSLTESIEHTGWWENIEARENNGSVEIAYGHHRMVALQRRFKKTDKVAINVRKMSNLDMLLRMSRENMTENSSCVTVMFETVQAALGEVATGEITAEKLGLDEKTRNSARFIAPSVLTTAADSDDEPGQVHHWYTRESIARWLGMFKQRDGREVPNAACQRAFKALELIELELVTPSQFKGKTPKEADLLIKQTRKQYDDHMAQEAAYDKQRQDAEDAAELAVKTGDAKARRIAEREAEQAEANRQRCEEMAIEDATKVAEVIANAPEDARTGDIMEEVAKARHEPERAKPPKPPNLDALADNLIDKWKTTFNKGETDWMRAEAIIQYQDLAGGSELSPRKRKALISSGSKLIGRLQSFVSFLENGDSNVKLISHRQ